MIIDRSAIILIIGTFGLIPFILGMFYLAGLYQRHQLTWDAVFHGHWIGVIGILGLIHFIVCLGLSMHYLHHDFQVKKTTS